MSLISQFSQAASFDCKGGAGDELKVKSQENQVKALWYGYKSIYAKAPTLLAKFSGELESKLGNDELFKVEDLLSELHAKIKLFSMSEFKENCNRAGCHKYLVTTHHATLELPKDPSHKIDFKCSKLK